MRSFRIEPLPFTGLLPEHKSSGAEPPISGRSAETLRPELFERLEKRAELERAIAELERQIRLRRAEIGQLDATICMFAPSVIDAKRQATRFKRCLIAIGCSVVRLEEG